MTIDYPARMGQLKDFDGMKATDVDVLIEVRDRAYVFGELKASSAPDAPEGEGQLLALSRMADRITPPGEGIVVVAEHTTAAREPIHVPTCSVVKYYWAGAWRTPKVELTFRQMVDWFVGRLVPNFKV